MKFRAMVIPSGNATAVEIPASVMTAIGPEARPPVAVTVNGHSWRSRVARMRGQCLIGISAANRTAAGIAEGESIEVDLELDRERREVALPPDVAAALDSEPALRAAFERVPFGLRRKQVADIESANGPEVRQRRIAKLLATLGTK